MEPKRRWMRLDNAAKIYPAARSKDWSCLFRLSVTLTERVDTAVLQAALDATVPRFPSLAARLRKGVFWYYLEHLEQAPRLREEYSYPLTRMPHAEVRKCAFRVIAYENRIALELFHSLTDGTGALIFLKSLTAEYLNRRCGISIPTRLGVLDVRDTPTDAELEDCFPKYAAPTAARDKENNAWHLSGDVETDGFCHVTCLRLPAAAALEKAHSYGVTLTTFLAAAMMDALQAMQQEQEPVQKRRKPIRLQIPVNLRRLFPSDTLRNFSLYVTPELLPHLGHYSFDEICRIIHHRMGTENTPKQMSMKIAANVAPERLLVVRAMPLFLKNVVMKAAFRAVGEKKSCLSLSNLGAIQVPPEMQPFIRRFDFILGVQATAPYNCGVLSFGDTLYINFIRNTRQPYLEHYFHQTLQAQGLPVTVESNQKASPV